MAVEKFKPHLLMVLAQICYTFLYFITKASFNHGMNIHVYVTYRHVVGGLFMLPFAYFLERQTRPKLTMALLLEFFVISLMGVGLTLNMYFVSLNFTSPTFVASMFNSIASLTFVLAVILRIDLFMRFVVALFIASLFIDKADSKLSFIPRLEVVNVQDPRGIAKIIGTLVSLAGVMTMTLCKGAILKNLWHPLIYIHQENNVVKEKWVEGSILAVASCITWSIWFIMQPYTLKRYPAQLTLTTWISFIGAAQSAFYTVIVQHTRAAWTIGFNNIDFWSTIYGGVVISGLMVFVQLWCTEQKGPVFVTMFSPLLTILVAFLAYFVFGEKLHMGSIIGAIIIIVGLYLLLWGKGDPKSEKKDEQKCCITKREQHEDIMMQNFTSDANSKDAKKSKQQK